MFDDDRSVIRFLDHSLRRYQDYPDAEQPVSAERFMRFPSQKLPDVRDTTGRLAIPQSHGKTRCPAEPDTADGTLVGRIIGRALDPDGNPVKDTLRQEHYMESRFEIPPNIQREFAEAARRAPNQSFTVPDSLIRALVQPAFLGQLDVDPLGSVPGSRNDHRDWQFSARRTASPDDSLLRLRLIGHSRVAGSENPVGARTDGRRWEHDVELNWDAFVDVAPETQRITNIVARATGDARLIWAPRQGNIDSEPDVRHLPAGHSIDLQCGVVFGLRATPVEAN